MDTFIDSVVSQTLHLSIGDAYLSSLTIQLISFYENSTGNADFMSSDKLEQAFYRALCAFPVYAGMVHWSSNGLLEVSIDKDNLNMPGYTESTTDILFGDLKAAKYNPVSWPPGLLSVETTPLPDARDGKTRMLNVHIVRCKDNSGVIIFVCGNHAIADGTGFYTFIQRWADEMRALVKGMPAPTDTFSFDRSILTDASALSRRELDSEELEQVQSLFSTERNREYQKGILASGNKGSLYRVSKDKLDRLGSEVSVHTSGNMRLSANDVLSALIAKTLAQAAKDQTDDGADLAPTSSNVSAVLPLQKIGIACNVRPRLGEAYTNYIGNGLYPLSFTHSFESSASETTSESLAQVACKIRKAVGSVQKQQVTEFFNGIEADPVPFVSARASPDKHKHDTIITNHSRFKIYEQDFGYGIPVFASPRPHSTTSCVRILPVHPPSNDVHVFIIDTPSMLKSIRGNKFWNGIAEFVY
ncbi:hypothetical protein DL89DRAFT_320894 [Linderina pennispora]|uniref:Transferase-domain-containing protein n=1 Tax=Linderina pennispora TaxID=61395 RepID=A0A1Y1WJK2_9FUNG|nr:uncharacterized protein DL89DRAFT_320894 [Linderina pennispora]ORX73284.1 hypothetical protein DL89DRAFT_320894 [Linderina pennispora]